jgi:hypothetical protein
MGKTSLSAGGIALIVFGILAAATTNALLPKIGLGMIVAGLLLLAADRLKRK